MLAAEERAQLEPVERGAKLLDLRRDLGLDRLVAFVAPQLEQRLDVGEPALEIVDELYVVTHRGELAAHLAGPVGIVPELGCGDLRFERGEPGPRLVDAEIAMGLAHAAREITQVFREVAHSTTVAQLVLLATPAEARLV